MEDEETLSGEIKHMKTRGGGGEKGGGFFWEKRTRAS